MSRGTDGQRIYLDDADRILFLKTISEMKAAKIVQIDIDKCFQAKRLHGIDKHKRDLIIYFLWNKGITTKVAFLDILICRFIPVKEQDRKEPGLLVF